MALQQQEPKKIYVRVEEADPQILYLPLNTTYTYTDQSPYQKTVTNSGVQFGSYSGVNCAYFNGSSQLTLPDISAGHNFTRSVWLNRTNTGNYMHILGPQINSSAKYGIYVTESGHGIVFNYQVSATASSGYTLQNVPSGWNHAVVVKSGTTMQVYLNGVKKADVTHGGSSELYDGEMAAGDSKYCIGNTHYSASGGTYYTGYLGDFMVTATAWTATDVLNYYNSTKSRYGL